jgi:hypothetical protein
MNDQSSSFACTLGMPDCQLILPASDGFAGPYVGANALHIVGVQRRREPTGAAATLFLARNHRLSFFL